MADTGLTLSGDTGRHGDVHGRIHEFINERIHRPVHGHMGGTFATPTDRPKELTAEGTDRQGN